MIELFQSADLMVQSLIVISLMACVITLAFPYFLPDPFEKRLRSQVFDRGADKNSRASRAGLRQEGAFLVRSIVRRLRLAEWLGIENSSSKLASAGFHGAPSEAMFIFFRATISIGLCLVGIFYFFFIDDMGYAFSTRIAAVIGLLYIGIKIPEIYLDKVTQERLQSIRRAFPDALDLLVICLESGISIEAAFRRVSEEVGLQSAALADELMLTTAELSFLPDRRQAYDNFARRVNLDAVRQIVTVLNQADRYGTPLAVALRLVAQESRVARMAEAERKAAALPPKLTIPMVLFFLPVLFIVILAPAITEASKNFF